MWKGLGPRIALAVLAMAAPCLIAPPADAENAAVIGARFGAQSDQTRFVLDLTAPAKFEVFLAGDPYRAVIDLVGVEWRIAATTEGKGLIAAVRYGPAKLGTSRVVLDLTGPAVVTRSFTLPQQSDAAYRAEDKARVIEALAQAHGNQTRAAEILGISRRTLVYRLGEYGIGRPRKR